MKIILFLVLFSSYIKPTGFAGYTKLLTKQGQTTFDTVDLNTLVSSDKKNTQPVLFFSKQKVAQVVHMSIADETIICHKKQLFWCVNKNDWVNAKDLLPSDVLQTVDGLQIPIDEINIIKRQTELYSLTVGPPHHLYVAKNGILAHNMTWFVGIGLEIALECDAIEFIKATFTVVVGAIALQFAKNKHRKKQKMAISVQPVCNAPFPDPNYDKNKYTYKNGVYEDADYHTKTQNGLKSPRPQDGQKALDNSIPVQHSPNQRVSIENGKIVTLQQTEIGRYHGYINTWEEIVARGNATSNIRATLMKKGLVSKTGKILL